MSFAKLQNTGFLRLSSIIKPNGPIPVSKSTWWAGIKEGRFPAPVKLGPRVTAWRVADIQVLLERGIPTRSETAEALAPTSETA